MIHSLIAPKKKSICHSTDSVVMTLDTSFFNITWNPTARVTVNTDTSILVFKPTVNTSYIITAQGGKCSAFDTLTFTVKIGAPTFDTIYDTVCTGTKWSQYPGTGIYNFVLTNQSGCDSNVELHLLKNRKDSFINISICQGSSYTYNSVTYSTTGKYSTKFSGANGCDSNMILNLKVNSPSPLSTLIKKVCEFDTFKYNGFNYTTDIIVTHILKNKFGCDSPVKLDLKFLPTYTYNIYDTFCSGDSFRFSNNQYYKTPGNYNFTYQNEFGCDSIIILHLAMAGAGLDTIKIDSIVFGNMCSVFDKKIYIYPLSINSTSKFSLDWGISYQPQSIFHNLKAGTYNIRIRKKCAMLDTVVHLPYRERDTTISSAELCQGQAFLFNNVIRTQTGVYWDTLINKYGCDSFLKLDLKIWKNDTTHLYDSICAGKSYTFDGQTYTSAGDYSSFTQSSHFCDSTTILHLTVNPNRVDVMDTFVCDGDTFHIWDTTYTISGSYKKELISHLGCDSTSWVNLYAAPQYNYNIDKTICKGDTFKYFSNKYTKAGIYNLINKTARYKCDSNFKITITVNPRDTIHRYDTISSGDTLKYLANKYTKAGIYKNNFYNQYSCDSFVYIHLYVNKRDSTYLSFQRCIGDSLIYIDSTWKSTGSYRYNLKNKKNIDSFIFINLQIKNNITSLVIKSICRSQSYLGYKLAGTYFDTYKRAGLCDSIRELRLIINDTTNYSYTVPICKLETYFFNGLHRSALGLYKDTLVNANGCDSFVYLTLTRKPPIFTQLNPIICAGMQFKKFKTTGIYYDTIPTAIGCDSIEEVDLTVLAAPYKTFQNFEACVSVLFKNKLYKKTDTIRDTISNYLNCDSVYRTTYIKIRPAPRQLSPRPFIFCDSFFIGNRRFTFSFEYTDTVRTSDPLHCDSTYQRTSYILKKTAPMHISASPNLDEYLIGESLTLETSFARNLFWSSGETTQKINIILYGDKTYQVIGWNDEECKDTASIILRAVAPAILDIPKAFAPAGMQGNQSFKPNYNGKVELIKFVIFNRWGEKIFEAKNINEGWDGSYKNQAQPAGVYTYMLEYKMNRIIYFKSGEILLVR
jgi:trimeric autotransporter adhesin